MEGGLYKVNSIIFLSFQLDMSSAKLLIFIFLFCLDLFELTDISLYVIIYVMKSYAF